MTVGRVAGVEMPKKGDMVDIRRWGPAGTVAFGMKEIGSAAGAVIRTLRGDQLASIVEESEASRKEKKARQNERV